MAKAQWSVRIDEDLASWVDEYAEQRDVNRTQILELAVKELRAISLGGVPEIPQKPAYRSEPSRRRRCFRCTRDQCTSRVFLNPSDPEDFVPQCSDHGPMVRDQNRPYRGQPTPV